jgi:hypothetical protein
LRRLSRRPACGPPSPRLRACVPPGTARVGR